MLHTGTTRSRCTDAPATTGTMQNIEADVSAAITSLFDATQPHCWPCKLRIAPTHLRATCVGRQPTAGAEFSPESARRLAMGAQALKAVLFSVGLRVCVCVC